MSITTVLDYMAGRARTQVDGLKNAYSPGAGDPANAHFFPQDIDDGPVAVFMLGGATAEAGNDETEDHTIWARIWVPVASESVDWAMNQIAPMPERFKAAFRTDITQGGSVVRAIYEGYDEPDVDEAYGKSYLTLDIRFRVLEKHPSHSYTAPFPAP